MDDEPPFVHEAATHELTGEVRSADVQATVLGRSVHHRQHRAGMSLVQREQVQLGGHRLATPEATRRAAGPAPAPRDPAADRRRLGRASVGGASHRVARASSRGRCSRRRNSADRARDYGRRRRLVAHFPACSRRVEIVEEERSSVRHPRKSTCAAAAETRQLMPLEHVADGAEGNRTPGRTCRAR